MVKVLSFYSKDFAIYFGLHNGGTLSGIFITKENVPSIKKKNSLVRRRAQFQHDFTGIYYEKDGNIDLVFYVDWRLHKQNTKSYSAFSGSITSHPSKYVLKLDWMLVLLDELLYPEYCTAKEPLCLSTDFSDLYIETLTDWPYPILEIEKEAILEKLLSYNK